MSETLTGSHNQVPISGQEQIEAFYSSSETAATYVKDRFESELMLLLSDRQVGAVQQVMQDAKPLSTLEVAPGPGRISRAINPAGELVCLEFNDEMITEGKRWCDDRVQWVHGNAFELPFAEGAFDFAYTFRFIRHFHRADRNRVYAQLCKVVRPGGLFMMDAVNGIVSQPLRDADPDDYPVYDKLYSSQQELRDELAEAGFRVIRIDPVQRWIRLQSQVQILVGPRCRWLCRKVIRALERVPRRSALEWIVTCRRAD